jgi:hypothetical protein
MAPVLTRTGAVLAAQITSPGRWDSRNRQARVASPRRFSSDNPFHDSDFRDRSNMVIGQFYSFLLDTRGKKEYR